MIAGVREISLIEIGAGWELHAKTGTMPELGWWVGWVQKEGRIYCFALNFGRTDANLDTAPRIQLGKACLEALGVL